MHGDAQVIHYRTTEEKMNKSTPSKNKSNTMQYTRVIVPEHNYIFSYSKWCKRCYVNCTERGVPTFKSEDTLSKPIKVEQSAETFSPSIIYLSLESDSWVTWGQIL